MTLPALPTGREGRILAGGILAAIVLFAWLGLVMPLIDWHATRAAALEARIGYATRMAAIADALPAARRAAADAAEQAMPTAIILSGTSDAIAGAALESLIDGLTHYAQATLVSTEALPVVQANGFRRIGLRVTVRSSWANLMQLLAAVERAQPRMSVTDMQIQAGPLGGAEQLLDMSFSANAFRAGTATAADAAAAEPAPADTTQ